MIEKTKDRQFRKVYKISMRKNQGGVSDANMAAFISTGNPALRNSLRAQNRNPKKHNRMNDAHRAEQRNRGFEFIQRFVSRALA